MQISRGQTLIRSNAILPQQLSVKGDRLPGGWILLNENAHEVDKRVRAVDWHFFWITDSFELSSFRGAGQIDLVTGAECKVCQKCGIEYSIGGRKFCSWQCEHANTMRNYRKRIKVAEKRLSNRQI